VFDQVQLLFDLTGFNDHQLHCLLRFRVGARRRGPEERPSSRRSRPFPSSGTRYVAEGRPDRAGKASIALPIRRSLRGSRGPSRSSTELVTSRINESTGPQVKAVFSDIGQSCHRPHDEPTWQATRPPFKALPVSPVSDLHGEPGRIRGMSPSRSPVGTGACTGCSSVSGWPVKLKSCCRKAKRTIVPADHRFPLSGGWRRAALHPYAQAGAGEPRGHSTPTARRGSHPDTMPCSPPTYRCCSGASRCLAAPSFAYR